MHVLIGPNRLDLEQAIDELDGRYPGVSFTFCRDWEPLAREIAGAEIYFGWLTREVFLAARNLRWIQSPSSGVDHFLVIPELCDGDVILTSARGTHGPCVAEHTLAMIFAFTRGIRDSVRHQQAHHWALGELRPRMRELTGATLGIVGLGAIGRALARRARAFDMRVIAVDADPGGRPEEVERLDGLDHLEDLLAESDYVVVTAPRTPATTGLIGSAQLALLKPSALLVGISRGGVIDETALLEALRGRRLAGAALDVVDPEPPPEDSPLWDLDNLLITPHIAGGSQLEGAHVRAIFADNLGRFLRRESPLRNQVDKQRGW